MMHTAGEAHQHFGETGYAYPYFYIPTEHTCLTDRQSQLWF